MKHKSQNFNWDQSIVTLDLSGKATTEIKDASAPLGMREIELDFPDWETPIWNGKITLLELYLDVFPEFCHKNKKWEIKLIPDLILEMFPETKFIIPLWEKNSFNKDLDIDPALLALIKKQVREELINESPKTFQLKENDRITKVWEYVVPEWHKIFKKNDSWNIVGSYVSAVSATKACWISKSSLSQCLSGKTKKAGGFYWGKFNKITQKDDK